MINNWLLGLLLMVTTPETRVDAGSMAYRNGDYAAAIEHWNRALANPHTDHGALHFNLGNSAFRLHRYSEAVFHYRSALLRMPRDPELAFNLRLAERELGIDRTRDATFAASIRRAADGLTRREWLLVATSLQVAGLSGLIWLRGRRRAHRAFIVLIVLGCAAQLRLLHLEYFAADHGMVTADSIRVLDAPHRDALAVGELPAGYELAIEASSDRWAKIRWNGGAGWTDAEGVAAIR